MYLNSYDASVIRQRYIFKPNLMLIITYIFLLFLYNNLSNIMVIKWVKDLNLNNNGLNINSFNYLSS